MVLKEVSQNVDDQLGNVADRNGEQGGNNAGDDAKGDDPRAGFPNDFQDRGDVSKRDQPLLPAAPKPVVLCHRVTRVPAAKGSP
jgi:hypothetical protein